MDPCTQDLSLFRRGAQPPPWPTYGRKTQPAELATRSQLRRLGLKPGGPMHGKVVWARGYRVADLYAVAEALPLRPPASEGNEFSPRRIGTLQRMRAALRRVAEGNAVVPKRCHSFAELIRRRHEYTIEIPPFLDARLDLGRAFEEGDEEKAIRCAVVRFESTFAPLFLAALGFVCFRLHRQALLGRLEDIADFLRCTVKTVQRLLDELVEAGYVIREHRAEPVPEGFLGRDRKLHQHRELPVAYLPGDRFTTLYLRWKRAREQQQQERRRRQRRDAMRRHRERRRELRRAERLGIVLPDQSKDGHEVYPSETAVSDPTECSFSGELSNTAQKAATGHPVDNRRLSDPEAIGWIRLPIDDLPSQHIFGQETDPRFWAGQARRRLKVDETGPPAPTSGPSSVDLVELLIAAERAQPAPRPRAPRAVPRAELLRQAAAELEAAGLTGDTLEAWHWVRQGNHTALEQALGLVAGVPELAHVAELLQQVLR